MSQKAPGKIASGKLALKKCWTVRTEAVIIPAPARKLQNRLQLEPSTVNDRATSDLLLLMSGHYSTAAEKHGAGFGQFFFRKGKNAGQLADDVDELRIRGNDDLGIVHQRLFDGFPTPQELGVADEIQIGRASCRERV